MAGAALVALVIIVWRPFLSSTPMQLPETLRSAKGYEITLSAEPLSDSSLTGSFIITEAENPEVFKAMRRMLSAMRLDSRVSAREKQARIQVSCLIEPVGSDGVGLWLYPAPLARVEDEAGTTTYRGSSGAYFLVRGLVSGLQPRSGDQ
jgi:hypothetical protein